METDAYVKAVPGDDRDVTVLIPASIYTGDAAKEIDERVEAFLSDPRYLTQRVVLVDDKGGIARILLNYTKIETSMSSASKN